MHFKIVVILLVVPTAVVALDVTCVCGPNTSEALSDSLQGAIDRASSWLEAKQRIDGSWPLSSTKEAIWALQLANGDWYSLEQTTRQLGVKQMQIELLSELARKDGVKNNRHRVMRKQKLSPGKFAYYISALNTTGHDVTDFYGHNLIEMLQTEMLRFPREQFSNYFQYGLTMLAVCNSGEHIKITNVRHLLNGQRMDGKIGIHYGMPDETAMAVMALHCVVRSVNHNIKTDVSQAIVDGERALMSWQQEDGSFGNTYSTGLVIQALMSSKGYTHAQWDCNRAMQTLLDAQHESGSFGGLGATISVLPALAGRHLGELKYLNVGCNNRCSFGGKVYDLDSSWHPNLGDPFFEMVCVNCRCAPIVVNGTLKGKVWCEDIKNKCPETECENDEEPSQRPGDCCKTCPRKGLVSTAPSPPVNSSIVLYLTVQNEVKSLADPTTFTLMAPKNASLYEFMRLAQQEDPETFSVEFGESSWGHYVKSINGLFSDGIKNRYWMLLDSNGELTSKGMDGIYPEHGDQYVWTYRALG